jgi:hypothetical protein
MDLSYFVSMMIFTFNNFKRNIILCHLSKSGLFVTHSRKLLFPFSQSN